MTSRGRRSKSFQPRQIGERCRGWFLPGPNQITMGCPGWFVPGPNQLTVRLPGLPCYGHCRPYREALRVYHVNAYESTTSCQPAPAILNLLTVD